MYAPVHAESHRASDFDKRAQHLVQSHGAIGELAHGFHVSGRYAVALPLRHGGGGHFEVAGHCRHPSGGFFEPVIERHADILPLDFSNVNRKMSLTPTCVPSACMNKAFRQAQLRALLDGPIYRGNRQELIRHSGLSHGRISQLLDSDDEEPFGERAAMNLRNKLAQHIRIRPDYFETPDPDAGAAGGVVEPLAPGDAELLADFHVLPRAEREDFRKQITQRAKVYRDYLREVQGQTDTSAEMPDEPTTPHDPMDRVRATLRKKRAEPPGAQLLPTANQSTPAADPPAGNKKGRAS